MLPPKDNFNERLVRIYTDGSCNNKKQHLGGGWGAVIVLPKTIAQQLGKEVIELCGYIQPPCTSNIAELTAVTEALRKFTNTNHPIVLYTDSKYVQKGLEEYMSNWIRRGWRTAEGSPIKNQAQWKELNSVYSTVDATVRHVKGHVGIEYNELADNLANTGRLSSTV